MSDFKFLTNWDHYQYRQAWSDFGYKDKGPIIVLKTLKKLGRMSPHDVNIQFSRRYGPRV